MTVPAQAGPPPAIASSADGFPVGLEFPVDQIRVTPQPPLGSQGISGHLYAQLGAMTAALGAEQSYVTALLNEFQTITQETLLKGLPRLLNKLGNLQRGRLQRIAAEVSALPAQLPPAPRFLDRLTQPPGPIPDLINRADVLRILAAASEQLPVTGS